MLILSRNTAQSIFINDGENKIEVKVLGVNGHGQVKLGIAAPRHVSVHREEIYERIQAEKQQATG